VLRCPQVDQKPLLDGNLNEPLWQLAARVDLATDSDSRRSFPAHVFLAHDEKYFYFAVQCQRAALDNSPKPDDPRTRDAELDGEDRVELLIDVDRDYATYYRLIVDHRGWTADACFADPTWNPQWYVAADPKPEAWTIEAAIPIEQLVPHPPARGDTWAIGLQRIIPATAFQSWTQPASMDVQPQGFGLLMFD
jgi:hypothetical protein